MITIKYLVKWNNITSRGKRPHERVFEFPLSQKGGGGAVETMAVSDSCIIIAQYLHEV